MPRMRGSFTGRQLVNALLTANALAPRRGFRSGVPSFFAAWLTNELAPHALGLTALDVAAHLSRPRRDPRALALAAASAAGLAYLVHEAHQSRDVVEEALRGALGEDYLDGIEPDEGFDLATPWGQLLMPFRFDRRAVDHVRDIPYTEAGKRGLLDIYRPRGPVSGAPVLLHVHGGAWTIGNKEQQGIPLMLHLAAQGWVCVTINYRLSPRDAFPAHIVDVKRAIAWTREHVADYGGDPSYIAITGGSAGGHLTALAALTANDPAWQPGFEDVDTSVAAAVPHYGIYDFAGVTGAPNVERMRDEFLARRVLFKDPAAEPHAFEAASPILRITEDAPDFFIIHGAHDTLVPVDHARAFVAKLSEVSRRSVVYAELPGTQHAFDVFPSIRSAHVVRGIERYLTWHRAHHQRPGQEEVSGRRA